MRLDFEIDCEQFLRRFCERMRFEPPNEFFGRYAFEMIAGCELSLRE